MDCQLQDDLDEDMVTKFLEIKKRKSVLRGLNG